MDAFRGGSENRSLWDNEQQNQDFSNPMFPEDSAAASAPSAADASGTAQAVTLKKEPKIIFGLMSAVAQIGTVEQLVAALQPHLVVVHHDFSQQMHFRIKAENARMVPNPKQTGYGVFAFTEGVIQLLAYCLEHIDFDYFQLLSPACLPIKPLRQFSAHIAASHDDAHAEFVDLATDRDAMMSYAPRAYSPYRSWRRKLLRQAGYWYFGKHAMAEPVAGVQILRRSKRIATDPLGLAAYSITKLASLGAFGSYLAAPGLYPKVGAAWFGARRSVCEYLVQRFLEPAVYEHYREFNDIAEISFQTLLGNAPLRIGPLNTYVNAYAGWHPHVFKSEDLPQLAALPQCFARKFPDDPDAEVRRRVLEWVTQG
ncbi:core-2/I-branching beta-1,6-N-acetylglucosaminyltransferase family protein [Methylotetracoccus oryzae]|uniref:hypothetical protein n=1 Tax=Methylotetracoccus oryzae TaxID=1919059 RepID=UPI00111A3609|nr:hypothetical protein [Methylotetracoccus oryzae]